MYNMITSHDLQELEDLSSVILNIHYADVAVVMAEVLDKERIMKELLDKNQEDYINT